MSKPLSKEEKAIIAINRMTARLVECKKHNADIMVNGGFISRDNTPTIRGKVLTDYDCKTIESMTKEQVKTYLAQLDRKIS